MFLSVKACVFTGGWVLRTDQEGNLKKGLGVFVKNLVFKEVFAQ